MTTCRDLFLFFENSEDFQRRKFFGSPLVWSSGAAAAGGGMKFIGVRRIFRNCCCLSRGMFWKISFSAFSFLSCFSWSFSIFDYPYSFVLRDAANFILKARGRIEKEGASSVAAVCCVVREYPSIHQQYST